MLVLTRKPGEVIVIGEEIEIKIISVDGEAVRIGISAPKTLPAHRAELLRAVAEENRRAAGTAARAGELAGLLKRDHGDGSRGC